MRITPKLVLLALLLSFAAAPVLPVKTGNAQPQYRSQPGEDLAFEHLTVVEGLPENSVWSMLQDHLGFLWFGTQNGLAKYDGYTYTIYKPDPDDPHSLSDQRIYAIHEDAAGDLWIGTVQGGLNHFDRETERFTRYLHDPDDPTSLGHNTVFAILEDKEGTLWLSTMGGGLNRYDPDEPGRFTRYRYDPDDPYGLRDDSVHGLWEDDEGMLWVGTHDGGLHRFDPATEMFTVYQHDDEDPYSLSHNDVNTIYQDREGTFWVGTAGGLNRFDPDTGRFTAYHHDPENPNSLSHDYILQILEDREGVLWVGVRGNDVRGGLNRFDRATGAVTRYEFDGDDPSSLGGNNVMSLYEDRQGALWVGTWGGGVSKLDRTVDKFPYYAHEPGHPNSLSTNQVLALHEDRAGILWIGTWGGGLTRLDRATNTFTHYKHDPTDPNSPRGNEIMAIHEDREGFLWLGSWNGLDRFDPRAERFTHYLDDPDDAPEVTTIYEDREGVLWLGTWMNGVKRYDRAANTFTAYKYDPADSTSLSDDRVGAIFEDEMGTLWFATGDGKLNWFDPMMETFGAETLMGGQLRVRSFARSEAMPGKYWLGTNLQGLHLYDFETDTSEAFTEKDGLPHDTILGLLEDDQGYVWVGTARGLSKFDPRTKTFRTYHLADRLQGNKLMTMPVHKGRDGTFFFGGSIGFIAFHPERVTDNPYVPPVVLTDFKLFTESVSAGEDSPLKAHVSVAEEIRLAHWQNDISFTFAALNYQASEQNRYAYQLENYKDDEWRYAGAGRTATYTNLAPGEYVFRAIGSNNSDVWNDEGASIRLVITPPWWKTLWAYALFLVLGTAGLFGLIRWRVRYLERRANKLEAMVSQRTAEVVQQKATIEAQAQKLQELDRLKSRFFANISHEFRTPLLLILGPLQDALGGVYGSVNAVLRKQIEMMQRSGFRLLRLINQLLDLSKLESGNMRLQARRANLVPFLKGIVLSFSSMAERKHITFELHTEQERLDLYFDPDKLEKVFYNLLSNAFKFTPKHGAISVHVGAVVGEDQVEIRVRDTGRGIAPDALPFIFDRFHQVDASTARENEGTGIGLALARELVLLHGGTITAESTPGQGSTFIICIPFSGEKEIGEDEAVQGDGVAIGAYREISLRALQEIESDGGFADVELPSALPAEAPTILLVEDNPDVRAYVKTHLARHYHLDEAADGAEGLEKARLRKPDLVISDVMMPRMDGYALCRAIKTDPDLNHIPVILLTAKAGEESKVEGLETGADDYIYKPFSADELLVRAENLIEIRRLLRQRFSREVVAVQPSKITVTSADAAFLEQVQVAVEGRMANSNFGAEWLADEVGLSPRQLRRKLKELTNLSTAGYIRSMRLQRAAQLLEEQAGNVSEVAYAVGFQDPKHFSKLFRQVFGMAPSQVAGV